MKEAKSTKKLFTEFPPVSAAQWKEKTLADLKGADFDKKLVWKTLEGFNLQPYYSGADLTRLEYLKKFAGSILNQNDGTQGPRYWVNREKIKVDDAESANQAAIDALNSGADGLLFDLTGKGDIDIRKLLNNILPLHCSVSFIADQHAAKLVKGYFQYESENHIETNTLFGSLNYDPIRSYTLTGNISDTDFNVIKEIIEITDEADRFSGLTINSSQFRNAGSGLVQELAFALNMAVEYIDKLDNLGIRPEKTIKNIEFSMTMGTDYFLEIGKLRALRILFFKIAEMYGVKGYNPGDLKIHSSSSEYTKTSYDPYVNMLRNTTEAMSAILGGCNAITIAPYNETFEQPTKQSRRIARNVSNMLKEESYFDKVVDPGAGSYYIENITDQVAEKAWALFQDTEGAGGFLKAFEQGTIQSHIQDTRDARLKQTAQRRAVFVGTNRYPNTKEQLDPEKIRLKEIPKELSLLTPISGAAVFENLRLATDAKAKKTGKRPNAYLAFIGDHPAMRTARAQFSGDFIGCGGFEIIDGIATKNLGDALEVARDKHSGITAIFGADEDYVSLGVEFAKKFSAARADGLLVLAGYPADIIEELQAAGVDAFIHVRANLVDTLTQFQQKLNII